MTKYHRPKLPPPAYLVLAPSMRHVECWRRRQQIPVSEVRYVRAAGDLDGVRRGFIVILDQDLLPAAEAGLAACALELASRYPQVRVTRVML